MRIKTGIYTFCIIVILILCLYGCAAPTPVPPPPAPTPPPVQPTLAPPPPTQPPAKPTPLPPTPTVVEKPAAPKTGVNGCPTLAEGTTLFTNKPDAYCLLIPNGFTPKQPMEGILEISGPALDKSMEPIKAMLTIVRIGSSGGKAIKDLASQTWSSAQPGYTMKDLQLGGDPAISAENLIIGEAGWKVKEIIVIHKEMTYKLTFTPVDDSADFAKALPDIQKLWDTVIPSLVFLF